MTTIRDELRAEAERHTRLTAMLPEPHQLLLADENDLAAMLDNMILIADEMCASSCRQLALLEQIVKGGI